MTDYHNIKVYLRVRPLETGEQPSTLTCCPDENEVLHESSGKRFTFTKVFTSESKQEEVYQTIVKPLIAHVINGANCTVFAYGPTGTGKTYTMEGEQSDDGSGLIPRAVSDILEALNTKTGRFSLKVSFLELYNEEVYDLLSGPEDTSKLKIYDDVQRKNSVKIEGLSECTIQRAPEIFDILTKGSQKRQTAATLLNAQSSRSHSIFSITVQAHSSESEEIKKISKLYLVDLAGSENIARSGAQSKNAREAGNINQSLLTLTCVVNALLTKQPHIPYRQSKLTRILQDSLGGSTRTAMIATVSPAEAHISNTISTLDYASRARCITNNIDQYNSKMSLVQSNRCSCSKDLERERMLHMKEISELEIRIRNEVAEDYRREVERKDEQLERFKIQIQEKFEEENRRLIKKIEELQASSKLVNKMYEDQTQKVIDLETENATLKEQLTNTVRHVTPEKKPQTIKRVPKMAPDAENDYANLTFDGDDEIVMVSAKKRPRVLTGAVKRECNPLTMSGKKRNLPTGNGDIEVSPVSPPQRVTRSRATRKKLAF